MIKDFMQLWTNDTLTDFAIRFNEFGFVAVSNNKSLFSKIIDESVCTDSHSYDWQRTLTEWVNFYLCSLSKYKEDEHNSRASSFTNKLYNRETSVGGPGSKTELGLKMILNLERCKYCNLQYIISEELRDHEEFCHQLEKNTGEKRLELVTGNTQ